LDPDAPPYIKSTSPELVDVKITDFCPFGCEFCYQGSTSEGIHASMDNLKKIASDLHNMGVFEVALGGGEPTMHPNFVDILKMFKDKNITPNFTTFSTHWLKNKDVVAFVKANDLSIGVSVHRASDIQKVQKIWDTVAPLHFYGTPFVVAQHVVGSVPLQDTIEVIRECAKEKFHLLLLGYKDVGFGKSYQEHNTEHFPVILKMALDEIAWNMTLSVDTAVLNNFPDLPEVMNNVDEVFYTTEEGKFSCYIDAVKGKCGASSYCDIQDMVLYPDSVEEFLNVYKEW
jgi:organic radical activating enzyme